MKTKLNNKLKPFCVILGILFISLFGTITVSASDTDDPYTAYIWHGNNAYAYNGTVYIPTKNGAASDGTTIKYFTVGYRISIPSTNYYVELSLERNGNFWLTDWWNAGCDYVKDVVVDGYAYSLFIIPYGNIQNAFNQKYGVGSYPATYVSPDANNTKTINLQLDNIYTVDYYGTALSGQVASIDKNVGYVAYQNDNYAARSGWEFYNMYVWTPHIPDGYETFRYLR